MSIVTDTESIIEKWNLNRLLMRREHAALFLEVDGQFLKSFTKKLHMMLKCHTSIKTYLCPKINARMQVLILFVVGKVENGLYIERWLIV